jgi:hypothetical protein
MHATTTATAGFAAAFLAIAVMQLPEAALALNPQPEVPSKPNPDGCVRCKNKKKKVHKSPKGPKHLPPSPIKR